jgi:hypothetical protein
MTRVISSQQEVPVLYTSQEQMSPQQEVLYTSQSPLTRRYKPSQQAILYRYTLQTVHILAAVGTVHIPRVNVLPLNRRYRTHRKQSEPSADGTVNITSSKYPRGRSYRTHYKSKHPLSRRYRTPCIAVISSQREVPYILHSSKYPSSRRYSLYSSQGSHFLCNSRY